MDSRPATITVDSLKINFDDAIAAHLATAITARLVADPDYDPWITDVRLWVDDELKDYTIAHVITSTSRVGGIILMHSVVEDDTEGVAEFVVISFDKSTGASIHQEVLSVTERYWLQNKGLVLGHLTSYLHLS
jgi:hypothetical protein